MDPFLPANIGAANPPPGVVHNFDHAQSRAIEGFIGMGVCIGITSVFVILRLYVKFAITHMWGWDDCACLMGYGLIIAFNAVVCIAMGPQKWIGKHIWDIRVINFTKGFCQSLLASLNLYAASAFFIKLSLFLLYLRLFKTNKVARWLIYGGVLVCGLFYSASIIISCVLYMPKRGQPDNSTTCILQSEENATSSVRLALFQGAFGTLSDVYLLVIPIRSVFELQLPTNRKLGISAVFLVGIVAVTCSIGNLSYRAKLLHTIDQTWLLVSNFNFSSAELSAGIICSCMPILPALFRGHAFKKAPYIPSRSRFIARSSRKPLVSDQSHSLDKHCSGKDDHCLEEINNDLKLESGSNIAQLDDAV